MSRSDKILKILKENPASSAEEIWRKLEKIGEEISKRSVQRDLSKLHTGGLIEAHAIGRDTVYSLKSPTGTSSYFVDRFWTELFEIQEGLAKPYGIPRTEYFQLKTLFALLPKEIKEEILPDLKLLESRLNLNSDQLGIQKYGFDPNMAKDKQITHSQNLVEELTQIVDKLASILHEKFAMSKDRS